MIFPLMTKVCYLVRVFWKNVNGIKKYKCSKNTLRNNTYRYCYSIIIQVSGEIEAVKSRYYLDVSISRLAM